MKTEDILFALSMGMSIAALIISLFVLLSQ